MGNGKYKDININIFRISLSLLRKVKDNNSVAHFLDKLKLRTQQHSYLLVRVFLGIF